MGRINGGVTVGGGQATVPGGLIAVGGAPNVAANPAPNGITFQFGNAATGANNAILVYDHNNVAIASIGPTGGWAVYGDQIRAQNGLVTNPLSLDATVTPPAIRLPTATPNRRWSGLGAPTAGITAGTVNTGDIYDRLDTPGVIAQRTYHCTVGNANPALATWVAEVPLSNQVSTPTAGFAKTNGTPIILSLTTPNDGNMHLVTIAIAENVTALETGGQVSIIYTAGGHASGNVILYNGGAAAGFHNQSDTFIYTVLADPNTTVTLQQTTALTAGGPTTVWASLTVA